MILSAKWKQLHVKCEAFCSYLETHKLPLIKNSITARIRNASGLGFPPNVYTQNANESINSVLKSESGGKKLTLKQAALAIQACVQEQQSQV